MSCNILIFCTLLVLVVAKISIFLLKICSIQFFSVIFKANSIHRRLLVEASFRYSYSNSTNNVNEVQRCPSTRLHFGFPEYIWNRLV